MNRLDVSVLQNVVLGPLLNIRDPKTDSRIRFVGGIRGLDVLAEAVDKAGDGAAFAMYPTSMEELLAVAETNGCDLNSVIQSYNYGGGFLDYVAGHGKNTPLNWQRASQGTNPAERKSPTPTLLP